MAVITTYSTLLTEIGNWLARSDISTDAPTLVQMWEDEFVGEPRNWGRWMEAEFNPSDTLISGGVIPVANLSDYLGLKYVYVNGSPSSRLDRVSLNQLYGTYPRGGETGIPRMIARDAENFVFGPTPDSDYLIKGVYYARPTRLRNFASDAASHFLIVNYPHLCLYGALLIAQPFLMNDKRIGTWQTFYDRALASYRSANRDEDVSGSPVQEILA
jgi:hypothetical protein